MVTKTKKVLVLAALTIATAIVAVEIGPDTAQAEPVSIMTHGAGYAAARVETAFEMVAVLPAVLTVIIPMATKGDLLVPQSCFRVQGDVQAECMDVVYELPAERSIVIESHQGTTTRLIRMDTITVAGMAREALP